MIYKKNIITLIMNKFNHNFMVPMPAPMPIALKNTVSRDVISGPEQETFIINIVKKALDKGIIDVEPTVSSVALDTLETSSASINNATFEEIGAINESIQFISDSTFRGKIFLGPIGTVFDDTGIYEVQIYGDLLIRGTSINLDSLNIRSKSNSIGLGIDNPASDKFMHAIYFNKNDNFSSQGSVLLDKVALINLPFGNFLDDSIFAPITTTKKRFEGARSSLRATYLSSDFTFTDKTSSDSTFTVSQKAFIDNLNSVDNLPSIYYASFECWNLTTHGGGIVGGVGQNLDIVLTKSNNTEETYLRMNAESGNIEFTRPFALNMSDFNIEASGSIGFTTNKVLNALFSAVRITFYRPLQLVNNIPLSLMNQHFEIRDVLSNVLVRFAKKVDNFSDDRIEDITVNYYTGTFLTQGRFGDVQIQADNYIRLRGPYFNPGVQITSQNNNNNPTLELQNKENYASSNNLPTSKTYLQSYYLLANSQVNFGFTNVCTNTQNDFIFSGYLIISSTDSTDPSHLHLRLDGSFNNKDTTNPTILTKTVIKRNTLTLESITFTESVDYSNSLGPVLNIRLTNTTAVQYNLSIKLEVIAI